MVVSAEKLCDRRYGPSLGGVTAVRVNGAKMPTRDHDDIRSAFLSWLLAECLNERGPDSVGRILFTLGIQATRDFLGIRYVERADTDKLNDRVKAGRVHPRLMTRL